MANTISIYTLSHENNIFYVGKTNNPERRLGEHLRESKRLRGKNPQKELFIKSVLEAGGEITMNVIATCKVENWQEVERKHIRAHNQHNELLNVLEVS